MVRVGSLGLALAFSVGLCALGGCTNLTKSGSPRAPRDPDCHFTMLSLPPDSGYVEVGTIDLHWSRPRDLSDFKRAIQSDVCAAGGDAAIARVNGDGQYIKATVIRRTSYRPGGAQRASAGRKGALGPAKEAPAALGCQYDTQCKGERVCVKGECVAPEPAATSATQ